MKKVLFLLLVLFSIKSLEISAQNALGSQVIVNELKALSGNQFIELYNEGGLADQSLSCYTLVIWKESSTSSSGDFYVMNFKDGVKFSGANRFFYLTSADFLNYADVTLYQYSTGTGNFNTSTVTTTGFDILQPGSVENAVFLFRSAGLADAVITKNNIASALALVNGFTKNILNINTCASNTLNIIWSDVANQLSSRNVGPAISGGVAERVNDGSCYGWVKDGGNTGTPGATNGPVGPSGPQRAAVYSSPTFNFSAVSYEFTQGVYQNVTFSPLNNSGSIPPTAVAFDATYENVDITLHISNINPTNLSFNIKIWLDNTSNLDNVLDPETDILHQVYSFTPNASSYTQTITIPNEQNRLVFIEIATTPGTCYRSEVKSLTGQAALPVLLKAFTVKTKSNFNELVWLTSVEQNNKGFEIQKSVGTGSDFKTISFVGTRAKDGNSNTDIRYSFEDADVKAGTMHYYRLKQVDFDGKFTFSAIKSIKPGSIESNLSVYPNPNQGSFTLTTGASSGKVNVFLLDNTGRVINQYMNVSSTNTKFNNLKKGFYTLKIVDVETGEQSAQRVVVQ